MTTTERTAEDVLNSAELYRIRDALYLIAMNSGCSGKSREKLIKQAALTIQKSAVYLLAPDIDRSKNSS
jgi:hypothetical protein